VKRESIISEGIKRPEVMRVLRLVAYTLILAVSLVVTMSVTAKAATFTTTPMFRLYNPNSGEHFYTQSWRERDSLADVGWRYEGEAWNSPSVSWSRVYRLYNPNSGLHHYTTDVGERASLMELGWRNEGVGWYSCDSRDVTVMRLYDPNSGQHHYTTSLNEASFLSMAGWNFEGTCWYGSFNTQNYIGS
jgi:hypothetical protein